MHIGKILTHLGLLLLFCTSSVAQVDTAQIPVNLSSPESSINIILDPTNAEFDLNALDSLVRQMDTVMNDLQPASDIYGHAFLKADSLKVFSPGDIVKVPDAYVLGSGDEIAVAIFGLSQMDAVLTVNDAGFVVLGESLPKVNVKGMPWGDVRELLRKRYSNYFRFQSDQFTASVLKPRSLIVNVIGEVERPGTYLLEATNTAWHALVAAGGPTEIGSVRNIEVITSRGKKRLDLYQLINDPSAQADFYLEDNALVRVAPLGDVVRINGAVLRPMRYEMYGRENLQDLIAYAGGLRAEAVQEVVQIQRYADDRLQFLDINLRDLRENRRPFPLMQGDEVSIALISDRAKDVVYVEGAVQQEGSYALSSTQKVSDLLRKARMTREAQLDRALLVRLKRDSTFQLIELNLEHLIKDATSADNLELQDQDRLVINDLRTYVDKSVIKVKGAVRKEVKYPFDTDAKVSLSQAIFLAGGLRPEAENIGYILRSDVSNRDKKRYLEVNIRKAISNPNGDHNIPLQPWDEVIVLSSSEFTDESSINTRGSFRNPDALAFHNGMTIKEAITLSGGLKKEASGRIQVYRNNANNEMQVFDLRVDESFDLIEGSEEFPLLADDELVALSKENFGQTAFVSVEGEVASPGLYAITEVNETIRGLITKAGGLTQEALVNGIYIERLDEIQEGDEEKRYRVLGDITRTVLQEGDIVVVPQKRNSIFIKLGHTRGSALSGKIIEAPYQKGKDALWYLNSYAGGLHDKEDRISIVVEQANGSIENSVKRLFKIKYPTPSEGATIHIIKSRALSSSATTQSSQYPKLKEGVFLSLIHI